MKYKSSIWDMLNFFRNEERIVQYQEKIRQENIEYFNGEIEKDQFYKLFNALKWLHAFVNKRPSSEDCIKPSGDDIIRVMELIRNDGKDMLEYAKLHKDDLRKNLIKEARKSMLCADYYCKLVEEDYFSDKELKEWRV